MPLIIVIDTNMTFDRCFIVLMFNDVILLLDAIFVFLTYTPNGKFHDYFRARITQRVIILKEIPKSDCVRLSQRMNKGKFKVPLCQLFWSRA